MDGTGPSSWSLAQVELLRALRRCALRRVRVFSDPDPLSELAQIARALTAGPTFKRQLNAWAAKWHLRELREVARLHVYFWAGNPAASVDLRLVTPSALPLVRLHHQPDKVISRAGRDVEWSQWVTLDPCNPLHPVCAHPNDETEADFIERARAHYKAIKKISTPEPPPRALARHADWYVHRVVAQRKLVEIATDRELFGRKKGEIDTIKKGIRQFRKRLRGK